jgi:hypothetical protein
LKGYASPTYGGPTVLIEGGGRRLLTDPTFDPPGGKYAFGWGTGSRKTAGPSIPAAELGAIDAVLLSHDHHVTQGGQGAIESELAGAPDELRRSFRWLPRGAPGDLAG